MRRKKYRARDAFTLVEMLVVVVVVSILMAGAFRLMRAVDVNNKTARTKARLQKLQNALSAFYSEYGTYPPVAYYGIPDPYMRQGDPYGEYVVPVSETTLTSENALRACRCQPVEYLSPTPKKLDNAINHMFRSQQAVNVHNAFDSGVIRDQQKIEWNSKDGLRVFRFGLLSFLLPRFTMMGGNSRGDLSGNDSPDKSFIESHIWQRNNPGNPADIYEREQLVVSRWLPNFENFPVRGGGTVMGVRLDDGALDIHRLQVVTDPATRKKFVLSTAQIYDGWGRDFYYHSAPPYQSYRVWSAGADGKTFPPWATPRSAKDRETVKKWTQDDIVLFDR